ncbi:DUF6461 domain-containing protein [Streptomyces sp. NPDC059378]|uniref:DUF6461 domain-containing protein n=1 Tax=Streptomyces sp. NPDC059378 TaxID=3346815 RepID=UPI0036C56161
MTSVTAADYAWIRSSPVFRHAMDTGYTLTAVRGVAPEEVLRIMNAEPQGTCEGLEELIEEQDELIDPMDYRNESFLAGAFTVPGAGGDWTLVMQFDSGTGMQPRFLKALSAGGCAVVHSSNGGKPMDFFHWYADGECRTGFESPWSREGSSPDELNPLLLEVGFELTQDEDGTGVHVDAKAAVLALAERLTGVRVTEELLRDAEYRLGLVPEEPAEEWTTVVVDITDARGERFHREFAREDVEAAMERARAQAEAPMVIPGTLFPPPAP